VYSGAIRYAFVAVAVTLLAAVVYTIYQARDSAPEEQPPEEPATSEPLTERVEDIQTALQALDFPVALPEAVPNGASARSARVYSAGDEDRMIEIRYLDGEDQVVFSFSASRSRQSLDEYVANDDYFAWTSVAINGVSGMLGERVESNESRLLLLRDETLYTLYSFALPPDDLVSIAASIP
jgi:hypothetical protein